MYCEKLNNYYENIKTYFKIRFEYLNLLIMHDIVRKKNDKNNF